jgi:catechol 2,3-dioxygenase-like lactoylglutathione lyase family enzyme
MLSRMNAPRLIVIGLLVATSGRAQEVRRPAITGIAYVRIYAKDPGASRRFYTQELLLPEAPCPTKDCARYQVGKDQYVEVVHATESQPDGLQVVAFRTTDAEALRRYLTARNVKVPPAVQQGPDGSAEFAVTDAEAHRITFVEPHAHADRQGVISHRLIHVGFVVKDRAAMDPLYRDVLGFRPYWHGGMQPERTDWVALQVPDGSDWLEYMLNVSPAPSHHLLGVMYHFSLGVANMDTAAAALERTGWKPHGEEHKQMGLDGKYQLNVFDPDEVRVEFMDFSPSQKPCCSDFTAPHPQP